MGSNPTFGLSYNKTKMFLEYIQYLYSLNIFISILLLLNIFIITNFNIKLPFFKYHFSIFNRTKTDLNKKFFFIINTPKIYFLILNIIFIYLIYSYIISDFSIVNIIENSHISIPILYKISGLWSNHEGSIFLWLWVISFYSFLLSLLITNNNKLLYIKLIKTQTYLNLFFSIFILFTSNPILRTHFLSLMGTELNPILQDPGLIIHPPFLYLGYLGFTIPFCYALILLKQDFISKKAFWEIKLFILISWIFLTTGIFLGSWWAYHELGWGGWWFWDPVENISLMPWLLATIILHALILVNKNKSFLFLTLNLIIIAYLLSIAGTFFVRSGLLASVHSFATDIYRATFIFLFLFLISILSGINIYYFIKNNIKQINYFFNISKENFIYYNIIIISIITLSIFIGTYSPTFFSYFLERQVSIGQTYYNNIIIPIIPFFIIIMGLSPFLLWHKSNINIIPFDYKFIIGCFLSIGFILLFYFNLINLLIILLTIWLILTILLLIFLLKKANGMILSHLGVSIFLLAVIISSFFEESLIKLINPGEVVNFKDYHFILRSLNQIIGPNFNSIYGEILMLDDKFKLLSLFFPEKRLYFINNIFTSKSVIHNNFLNDCYILLGDGNLNNGWYTRIMYKPGMTILWSSFILLIIGGLKSLYELKYSLKKTIIWN